MTFYQRRPSDPRVAPVFANMYREHFKTVAHFVAAVLGGPKFYSRNGSHLHSTKVAKHLSRHLTEPQRKRWIELMLDTADPLQLPDDPEFRSALVICLEWGTRIAVINSATDKNSIDTAAPMPKWGWGEVKGLYSPQ